MTDKRLRWLIIIVSILTLLSCWTFTITLFAYGPGRMVFVYLCLYLLLFVSIVLVIAKVPAGYWLVLAVSVSYAILLNGDVGEEFLHKTPSFIMYVVLLIPYVLSLANIPLSICYLCISRRRSTRAVKVAIMFSVALPLYSVADLVSKDYKQSVYADIEFMKGGTVKLTCKPGFADSRQFSLVIKSQSLAQKLKANAERLRSYYYISDLRVVKSFRFRRFLRLKIEAANRARIPDSPVWKVTDLKGDISFLRP